MREGVKPREVAAGSMSEGAGAVGEVSPDERICDMHET